MNEEIKVCFDPKEETLEDLGRSGMRLIQSRKVFRYGTDSVLLADFACSRRFSAAVDLGAGSGVIGILMAAREPRARVDGVEIQPTMADLMQRNILLNGLTGRMRGFHGDIRQAASFLGYERYQLAVANPPYYDASVSLKSPSPEKNATRQDGECSPAELCAAAFALLRDGGRFCVIYPAARIPALMRAMHGSRIAPKRLRSIHDAPSKAPKLILLEGIKNGGEGLEWLAPLLLHEEDGSTTEEYRRIYNEE